MDLGLRDRRALVLGSTRGIGRAIAAGLAAEGAHVALCGRDEATAGEVAAAIAKASGVTARGYGADLTEVASVDALIEAVGADFGAVDIVVNNGGGPPPGPVTEVDEALWLKQFRAMFLSQVGITGAFLPGMRERGWGRVLVTSSSGAVQPIAGLGISNTLRGALLTWVKTLAAEVGGDGVTVNTILPGRIKTERLDEIDRATAKRQGKTFDEVGAASRATIPLGRYGTVEEYADVAVFILSDRAGYLTGSVIPVDGGFIRGV